MRTKAIFSGHTYRIAVLLSRRLRIQRSRRNARSSYKGLLKRNQTGRGYIIALG